MSSRITRSASARARSPTPTPIPNATIDARSRRSSGKGTRSNAVPQDGKDKAKHQKAVPLNSNNFGARDTKLAGERSRTTVALASGNTVGHAIGTAATRARAFTEQSSDEEEDQLIATIQEEDNAPAHGSRASTTSDEEDFVNSQIDERRSHPTPQLGHPNGNQPSGWTRVLQRQLTLSTSDSSIDRPLSSLLNWLHYTGFAVMMLVLILLFADIYRGPLLGRRFDLLASRHSMGNHSTIVPSQLAALEHRMITMERGHRKQIESLKYELHSQPKQSLKGKKINFFSHLHGVAVDPHLTSPTNTAWEWCRTDEKSDLPKEPTWWQRNNPIKPLCPVPTTHQAPVTVFGPWDESEGPSWCAASGDAVLQLATTVQGPMTPTELVVEYNPNSIQINPGLVPAPKQIELWMSVSDDSLRESIGRDFEAMYGPTEGHVNALPQEYVPIGRWTYDLHSPDYMQMFMMPIDLRGATTGNLVVRVNSNWAGAPYACLYRLRLHGIPRARE
ncbi:MAG: hypothetical protein Q9224_001077 [Gallowayella concinna]